MDRSLGVRTPESIAFHYDLAGLASRFLAVAIDFAIQLALTAAIFGGIIFGAARLPHAAARTAVTPHWVQSAAMAIIIAIVFAIFFGYFILFEAFWDGRTPGKKLMGLRVVRDGGFPVDFMSSLIRNLVRVGEVAIGFYAIAAISSVLSPENKRLGDMAAGTIVVRETRAASLASLTGAPSREPVPGAHMTADERRVIDGFLARRGDLEPLVRRQIALRLMDQFRDRIPPEMRKIDDEELLERLSAT